MASAFIQSMSPTELADKEDKDLEERFGGSVDEEAATQLGSYIQKIWWAMRNHRASNAGWNQRMLNAQRVFNRQYDSRKLAEIREFGGSEVYAGLIATKVRGSTSILREVYFEGDRPWGLSPTPEPTLPDNIEDAIRQLVESEVRSIAQATGQMPDPLVVKDRLQGLVDHALGVAKKNARDQAERAEDKVDDYLTEGGFYTALSEFLVDLPIFPFACIKGPIVRVQPLLTWKQTPKGPQAVMQSRAKMFWQRVSPFDIFWTPGVSDIRDGDVIEIERYTRADLNTLIGVPGYDEKAIRKVLNDFGTRGWKAFTDPTDSQRAIGENRESPSTNESGIIDCIEFHGNVQGKMLHDFGLSKEDVPDADLDYFVQVWQIGPYTIKAQIHPSPRKRVPYFITSYEKVPGTPVGNGLSDILGPLEEVANATLRSAVNNMAMSSGPQVMINDDRLVGAQNNDEMFPWKRWHYQDNPMNRGTQAMPPIAFFQPQDNSAQYLVNYEKFMQMADELSAIPRYITGSDRMGGAGRTASGLAMLMGNSNKILKNVCANIDRDVLHPLIEMLYDFMMLTDESGLFRGDESIVVQGVQVAVQRETNRQRQMELLQGTLNPTDLQIMGPEGRRALLAAIAKEVGLPGEEIVPDEDTLKDKIAQAQQQAAQAAQAQQEAMIQQNGERSVAGAGPGPKGPNTDLGAPQQATTQGMVGA